MCAVDEVIQIKAVVFLLQHELHSWTLVLLFSAPMVLRSWRYV